MNTTRSAYQVELANKIGTHGIFKGRACGNEYIVTRRPIGCTTILARFSKREDAETWIDAQVEVA